MVIQRVLPPNLHEQKQEPFPVIRIFLASPFVVLAIIIGDFHHNNEWGWQLFLVQAYSAIIISFLLGVSFSEIKSAIRCIKLVRLRRRRTVIQRRLRIQTSNGTPYRTLSAIPMEALLRWRIAHIPDQCSDDEREIAEIEALIESLEAKHQMVFKP